MHFLRIVKQAGVEAATAAAAAQPKAEAVLEVLPAALSGGIN